MKKFGLAALALSLMHMGAGSALAQNDKMTPIATPAQPAAITLDTGTLPGATAPKPGTVNTTACSPATSRSPR